MAIIDNDLSVTIRSIHLHNQWTVLITPLSEPFFCGGGGEHSMQLTIYFPYHLCCPDMALLLLFYLHSKTHPWGREPVYILYLYLFRGFLQQVFFDWLVLHCLSRKLKNYFYILKIIMMENLYTHLLILISIVFTTSIWQVGSPWLQGTCHHTFSSLF